MASYRAVFLSVIVFLVQSSQVVADVTVSDLVDQVSQQQYRHYLDDRLYTHNGDNKGMGGPQHDLCRDNIVAEFQSMGLATTLEVFPTTAELTGSVNVVATKPGLVRPQDVSDRQRPL